MAGHWFEQFDVGQSFDHEIRRTVTEADNMWFSNATCNPAAILHEGFNQRDELVCTCLRQALMRKAPK